MKINNIIDENESKNEDINKNNDKNTNDEIKNQMKDKFYLILENHMNL